MVYYSFYIEYYLIYTVKLLTVVELKLITIHFKCNWFNGTNYIEKKFLIFKTITIGIPTGK